jgi:hypothetical protein
MAVGRTCARLALLLCACLPHALLAGPDTPAIMLVTGRIAAGSLLDSTAPQADDQVLAFSAVDGQLVGSGPVASDSGDYLLVISRTASFNGTPVVLELMQGRRRYQLLHDAAPAWLRFHGKMLPERTPLALALGLKTVELEAEAAALPQAQRLTQRPQLPCDAAFDSNGDGRCDQQDWDVFTLYRAGVARSVAHPE